MTAPPQSSLRQAAVPAARGVAVAMLTLYVLWSSTYLAIRVAVETLPPLYMAGARFLTAGILLYAFLRMRGAPNPTRTQWRNAGLVGLFMLAGGNGLLSIAETRITSGSAAILVATSSLWATLFAWFAGIKPRLLEWLGVATGLSGIVLLNLNDISLLAHPGGVALVLTGALLWAGGAVLALRLELPSSAMTTAVQMLVSGVFMLLVAPAVGETVPQAPSARSIAALVYLTVVAIAGFTAFNYALRNARPALVMSYVYVNPALAVLLGALLLGETVTGSAVAAMGLVVAGVVLVVFAKR